ncbi:hypothetical protein [Candidatus Laterigemmans baculatus]|uniref:hypothetical protein n=1 Tax=Candidatus Laterigemmans baculatus TaxID=2770505 RepID=UPI0013D96248|nr:hypothetical protein [Candidatus Laterigemmans baculatus]
MAAVDSEAVRYRFFEASVGLFGLGLLAVTWRLWMPQELFPRVPLLRFALAAPAVLDYLALAAVVVGLLAMAARGVTRRGASLRWLVPLGFGVAVVLDQHRLQPWAYQISALAALFALCTASRGLFWIRVLTIGIYGWSAVGKLDFQFVHTVGTQMIEAMVRLVGRAPENLSPEWVRGAALGLPVGEAAVAILLAWPHRNGPQRSGTWTRRIGVVLAVALHTTLILVLGPIGLGHQPGVLVWNLFFALQAVLLFWPTTRSSSELGVEGPPVRESEKRESSAAAGWIVVLMLSLPVLERSGRFDHWLSWALYAPHSSRATVYVTPEAVGRLPESLAALVEQPSESDALELGMGRWVRVPIDRWSLATLGVPIYPQDRFQVGVAFAIAREAGLDREIRVVLRSASNRFSGERESAVLAGRPELQRAAERFAFSAIPK